MPDSRAIVRASSPVMQQETASRITGLAGSLCCVEGLMCGVPVPGAFVRTDTPFTNRAETLAASKAFKDGGGRLVRLTFPETRSQQLGDVVVFYGRFDAVTESGGSQQTVRCAGC